MLRVWAIVFLFISILAIACTIALSRESGSTGIDPAQIAQMRS